MHFFYLDETGCTGGDLDNEEQPIFVLGGVSVDAKRWRGTINSFQQAVSKLYQGAPPPNSEVRASDLVNGEGEFKQFDQERRNLFAQELLGIIVKHKHPVHLVAIDKKKLLSLTHNSHQDHPAVDVVVPYLLSFNYLVSYIERYTREALGSSARSMLIIDEKRIYHEKIDTIVNYRRHLCSKNNQLKWLVEFTYPIDSRRNPMIQLSDLVIFLVRKFLEMENRDKKAWPSDAKKFFAECYSTIYDRIHWKKIIDANDKDEKPLVGLLRATCSGHHPNWRTRYCIGQDELSGSGAKN